MRVRHLPGPADPLLPAVPRSRPRPGPGCPAPAAAWPAVQHPAQDRSGLVDGCLAEPGPARPSGLADSAQHHTFNPSGREGSSCLPPWSRAPCCSPGRGQGTSGSGSHFCCRRTRRPASGRRSWRRRLGMRSAGRGLRVPRGVPGPYVHTALSMGSNPRPTAPVPLKGIKPCPPVTLVFQAPVIASTVWSATRIPVRSLLGTSAVARPTSSPCPCSSPSSSASAAAVTSADSGQPPCLPTSEAAVGPPSPACRSGPDRFHAAS